MEKCDMTPRELVKSTLEFRNTGRVPRQLWRLPWAEIHYPGSLDRLLGEFPDDILHAPGFHREAFQTKGEAYKQGLYEDPWGCIFENRQDGIIGEVKEPIVTDWSDTSRVRFPEASFSIDIPKINQFCRDTDRFVLSGCCPRPFEQIQFIRGTEALYMDLALDDEGMHAFLRKMHSFYVRELELWAQTEVDALMFMDDWGSQLSLLINPETWRAVFKPLYAEYVRIAHGSGKKIFMHSDGNILQIYPDLIEIGVDAVNSQIFCMGLEKLAAFAGKITFWGEMDRQHLLVEGTPEQIAQAVRETRRHLYRQGGVIAQCEFGPGASPERVHAVYETWNSRG